MTGILRWVFFFGDIVLLDAAIMGASILADANAVDRTYLIVFSNLGWLFLVLVSSPYTIDKGWGATRILKSQLAFIFIHLLILASLIFFFARKYSFLEILAIYGFFIPLFFSWRITIYYLRKVFTPELIVKNYVIIGRDERSRELRKHFLIHGELGYRFKGYLNSDWVKNDVDKIREYCSREDIHEIFYSILDQSQQSLSELVNFGLDSLIKVSMIVANSGVEQGIKFDSTRIELPKEVALVPLDDSANQAIKRAFDLLFSGLFLITVMSWLLPLLFIAVKLDSRGPLFFRQARSGKGNRPFMCLKFRTMVINKESDELQATRNDPRITRVGAFLRRTSLDELPQFINVFTGSMSVVGPRPHMLRHTEEYSQLIETFMGRHYVKPGITGLAQCMGFRGETRNIEDMINRVRLDRHYIENWSFWLDLKIIVLTVISLIRGSDKAF